MKNIDINGKWEMRLPDHRQSMDWKVWEKERLAAMQLRIHKGDVLFDIGAEEGDLTALFGTWGADVVAFEPNPLFWPNIKACWEANNYKPLKGHFVGFASDNSDLRPPEIEGTINRPDKDNWPACAYGVVTPEPGFRNLKERKHDTPQITIDDYVFQNDTVPTILNLDVEGAEYFVLKGAEKTLRENDVTVFVSIHPEFGFTMYNIYEHDVHDFMRKCGYEGFHIAYDHEHHYRFAKTKNK